MFHKRNLKSFIKLFFIIALVISWQLSGFPPIWLKPRVPPNIKKVKALNQLTNYGFASALGAEWSVNAGTHTTAENLYGRYSDASSQDGDGYDFQGKWTGSKNNQTWSNKCLWQTFTPGSNVKVKLRGYYKRTVSAANDSSTVKLELLSGVSSCTTGTVLLTAYSDTQTNPASAVTDANWTTAPDSGVWTSDVSLTSGTTYYMRIFFSGQADSTEYGGGLVDNVQLNIAPLGLSASTPSETTNIQLDWTTSVGNPGLNVTTPYKVYRKSSAGVAISDYLADASSNTYTDSSTTGNTTYYYAVTNLDTSLNVSPLSTEVSKLTLPDAPTDINFTNVKSNTLRVNWTAPTGGASTYKIERCQGTGCSNYSEIQTGVANAYYDDSSLSANTVYRYRVRATNATGDGNYATAQEVTTKYVAISLTTGGSISYGLVATTKSTLDVGGTQTVRNDGTATIDLTIKTSNATNGVTWTLNTTPETNQYVHEYSSNGGTDWTTFTTADSYQSFYSGLSASGTKNCDLRITVPSFSSDYSEKNIYVTILASE